MSIHNPPLLPPQSQFCFEGEKLSRFLKSIQREIESARAVDASLPQKFWIKQQFAVGVNEVTRSLERMPPNHGTNLCSDEHFPTNVDDDTLAASRNVPLILLKDRKEGSLRLGELVKLKTSIAIGIKAKGNAINQAIKEVLVGDKIDSIEV
ncbi:hypothetical protein DH2020_011900 [Rehmannia glutinosa]|uniref:Uncharacterized protein n=1 Tax=Rehmannia glutinosa TaxID=99300 RepID=A0ABR0XET6_REHGL